jgi:hypothetical protein
VVSIDHRDDASDDASDPDTVGVIAQAATRHLAAITSALHPMWPSADRIGIQLPRHAGDEIIVSTSIWTIAVPTSVAPPVAAVDLVESRFSHEGWNCERVGPTSVVIGQYPDLLRVDALDETPQRLRCTMVIATDVDATDAVFAELNEINAGLVDTKVWYDDRRIIIGIDTADAEPAAVATAWQRLIAESAHLGEMLGVLGAELSST